ncbi:MAG: DMT family transporter [Candidatus Omnitrophica bacterium]|nr:DMT family transporter [Candidatus Omnitrophota bacterium]
MSTNNRDNLGLLLGFIAVLCFGLTLPLTRFAVTELDPVFVSMGRAFIAAIVAAIILWVRRAPFPTRKQIPSLLIVGFSISIAFPLLVAYAMVSLPASHGGIVIGFLPIATTFCIYQMDHEQPSKSFWVSGILGAISVVGYAILRSGGILHPADILLLVTVVVGAIGYAHGAILAKSIGGMQVMCWALVLVSPILAFGAIPQFLRVNATEISWPIWAAFIYLSLISQLFGMALWYKALSLGSIVKISQIQLLQPFFTIGFAALLFGEHIDTLTWVAAILVVLFIQLSRHAQVKMGV